MAVCVSCGWDNPDETRYCLNCGIELGYEHVPTPRPEIVIDDVPPPDDVAQRVHEPVGEPGAVDVDPLAGPAGVEVDAPAEPAGRLPVDASSQSPVQPGDPGAQPPPQRDDAAAPQKPADRGAPPPPQRREPDPRTPPVR